MSVAIIAVGVSAGIGLWQTKKSSAAAKEAAAIQVKGTDTAQAFNERVYADQQKNLAPYMQAGTEALGRLNARGAPSNPYASATFDPRRFNLAAQRPPGMGGQPTFPQQQRGGMGGGPMGAPVGGGYRPPNGNTGVSGFGPGGMPPPPVEGPQGAMPQGGLNLGGGRMVTIQAPTGETRQVPIEQAQSFIQRGGRVVQ